LIKNNKNTEVVICLDPKGIIISGGDEVIARQSNYARGLHNLDLGRRINFVVFSTSDSIYCKGKESNFFSLHIISTKSTNLYRFAIAVRKLVVENDYNIKLIVVGDPWESYWSALIFNWITSSATPIQIGIHADIGDKKWRRISIRNQIKFIFAKLILSNSSLVRSVSRNQTLKLVNCFGLDQNRITIAPIPIDTEHISFKSLQRPVTIGFIGRIHTDRGIWNFVELIRILKSGYKDFSVVIAGDGPDRDKFLHQLEMVISKNQIKYLGQISQEKLGDLWKSIGVLVSMAPVESYGRVLRESLLAGVPVWAIASSGVLDLLESAEPGTVKVLDLEKDESKLHEDFESLLRVKVGPKFRDKFIKENNSYADKLAKSWIDAIENFKS
jgi:glycosyltransferase involved in cell wall biosynthesis